MAIKERRLKVMLVDFDFFIVPQQVGLFRTTKPSLPDNAEVERVFVTGEWSNRPMLAVVIYSPDFEELPEGAKIPNLEGVAYIDRVKE